MTVFAAFVKNGLQHAIVPERKSYAGLTKPLNQCLMKFGIQTVRASLLDSRHGKKQYKSKASGIKTVQDM